MITSLMYLLLSLPPQLPGSRYFESLLRKQRQTLLNKSSSCLKLHSGIGLTRTAPSPIGSDSSFSWWQFTNISANAAW